MQDYVEALAPLVPAAGSGHAEAARQLMELVNEILLICACVGAADFSTMRRFHCFCLDSTSPAEAPVRPCCCHRLYRLSVDLSGTKSCRAICARLPRQHSAAESHVE